MSAGIYVAEVDAIAAAAAADPETDTDMPGWVWRVSGIGVFTSVANDSSQRTYWKYDLKARRRLPGESFRLMLVLSNANLATVVNVDGIVRTLWLRP